MKKHNHLTRFIPRVIFSSLLLLGIATHGAFIKKSFADDNKAALNTTPKPTTPIEHMVVFIEENVSFDRYFGVYPNDNMNHLTKELLTQNPNSVAPYKIKPTTPICSNHHEYHKEIKAVNGGLMNKFVEATGRNDPVSCHGEVMGYFGEDTLKTIWPYAHNYAINDNAFTTQYGPSTPGALNIVAGSTGYSNDTDKKIILNRYVIDDANPKFDDCSLSSSMSGSTEKTISLTKDSKNIGNLLNKAGVTWGFFAGGFKPTERLPGGEAVCNATSKNMFGYETADYIPHHEPFQYYASTSNPHHLPPSAVDMIGKQDQANHQYDLSDFWESLDNNTLPAVSFLKPIAAQDGHGGYSDPLDEQKWLSTSITKLMQSKEWAHMAIIIVYDDSDGDYDHVYPPLRQNSEGPRGFGPRVPFLVISPYAKENFVDHTQIDQSSIVKFIEDNWRLGSLGNNEVNAGPINNMFNFTQKPRLDIPKDMQ